MADPRRSTGIAGEDAAAELLARAGYALVARNFRTNYGELDIVAVDGDCLVFCEVRTRVGRPGTAIDYAIESIGPRKQAQLRRMAHEWWEKGNASYTRRNRFDVVAVAVSAGGRVLAIKHIREAF